MNDRLSRRGLVGKSAALGAGASMAAIGLRAEGATAQDATPTSETASTGEMLGEGHEQLQQREVLPIPNEPYAGPVNTATLIAPIWRKAPPCPPRSRA